MSPVLAPRPILPLTGLPLSGMGSASLSEVRKDRLNPQEGRIWFIRGGKAPSPAETYSPPPRRDIPQLPLSCPPLTLSISTCRSGEVGTKQCRLCPKEPPDGVHSSGLQGTDSEPGGALGSLHNLPVIPPIPGCGQEKDSEAGLAGPFCPPVASLTQTTLPPLGFSPGAPNLTPSPSSPAHCLLPGTGLAPRAVLRWGRAVRPPEGSSRGAKLPLLTAG